MALPTLRAALDEFGAAFRDQDPARLRAVFDPAEASLVASESLVLADRGALERFFDAYCAQAVSFSFLWDSIDEHACGDLGWLLALGREIRHGGQDTAAVFRLTMVGRQTDAGWLLSHVHASTPTG